MTDSGVARIVLDEYGSYLGRGEGCFVVRDKHKNETKYPLFEEEIGEAVLSSGNYVSRAFTGTDGGIFCIMTTRQFANFSSNPTLRDPTSYLYTNDAEDDGGLIDTSLRGSGADQYYLV